MPGSDFDIYQTKDSYVAVTNAVRRQILAALAKKDRMLPELVKITKKAKPTLSSVHIRELLAAKLVEEIAHPTDKRRKIYRLKARRIGTSSLPVGELRDAVRQYAGGASARGGFGLALEAIAAAPSRTPDATLRAQARRLGALAVSGARATSPRAAVSLVAAFLEREGLARPLRLDLEQASVRLELDRLEERTDPGRLATLLSGLAEGLLGGDARAKIVDARGHRLTLQLALQGAQR